MQRRLALISVLTLLLGACPGRSGTQAPVTPSTGEISASDRAQLRIPPSEASGRVLQSLEVRADAGDSEAAWLRAHYLLDLFDAARFGGDESSRKLLGELAGRPQSAMRGPAATQAIAELLVLEFDHVLELDRSSSLGQMAHTLATYDAEPPRQRQLSFQRMQELKRIVANDSPLALNARLRLFAYCRSALQDAAEFEGPARRIALAHCLYPLFESNPAPYFETKPALRPPPPSALKLHQGMAALLDTKAEHRLQIAIEAQRAWHQSFTESAAAMRGLDPIALRLPPSTQVAPYDDFPLVPDSTDAPEKRANALRGPLVADGRGVAALALASEVAALHTLSAAQVAARAGARRLAILVGMQQRLSVPRGDYWSGRLQGGALSRAGEIQVSLALLEDQKRSSDDAGAKALGWDPSRASLALHLLVAPTSWRLVSPKGALVEIETASEKSDPSDALRRSLALVRAAFPDEDGLVLVPEKGSSHGALVAAAEAARIDAEGGELFSQLAIRSAAPAIARGTALEKRIALRAAARVEVEPSSMATRLPIARRCYQDLLDARKNSSGEIRIELGADGKASFAGAKGKAKPLAECASKAFLGPMLDAKAASVVVQFSVQAK